MRPAFAMCVIRLGATDPGEIRRIETAMSSVRGVSDVKVDTLHYVVTVKYDPRTATLEQLREIAEGRR